MSLGEREVRGRELVGRSVVFAGRLASMTRVEAEELVRRNGGTVARSPTRDTDYLVVGQETWPLGSDGGLNRKMARARELKEQGHPLTVLREEEFLARIGLTELEEHIHRLYTAQQLGRILGIPGDRLRRWIRSGFIRPTRTVHRLAYFDFSQVATARGLWKLVQAGVPVARIRQSLRLLRAWMPDVENPLAQLPLLDHDRQILVRLGESRIADPTGQLYFPFPEFAPGAPAELPIRLPEGPRSVEEWIDLGLRYESESCLEEAERAYRRALSIAGPDAEICFNLGNVVYSRGDRKQAAHLFLEAVRLDEEYVEAWNNLGNVLAELGEWREAIITYRRALEIEPLYADAHFNLAEALSHAGEVDEARVHWRAYLRQDPRSSWADQVRERLRETAGTT